MRLARNLQAEYRIPPAKKIRFFLKAQPDWVAAESGTFARLVNAEALVVDPQHRPGRAEPRALTPLGELYLPLEGVVDAEAERARLAKEIAKAEAELLTVRKKLTNQSFVANAPAAVVEEHRKRETDWDAKLGQLRKMRQALEG